MAKLPIPFDNPATYPGHSGVDYGQPRGTPFRASGPGRVVSRSSNRRGGYYVWVQYDNGPRVGYHHMDSHRGVPSVGTRVSEGTLLGYVGSLGQYSTGPHLHSEVSGHRSTAGYWKFFDPNRVVSTSGGGAAGSEDVMNPAQEAKLDRILSRVEKGLTGERIAGAVWARGGTGDLLKRIDESVRFGEAGSHTHGKFVAASMSEYGAQRIFRASQSQGGEVDVEALAEAIAENMSQVDAAHLADAILKAAGKALSGE